MTSPAPFDEARWAAFLGARARRLRELERHGMTDWADAVFHEHFVQATETQTWYVAQREVGALMAAMAARGKR